MGAGFLHTQHKLQLTRLTHQLVITIIRFMNFSPVFQVAKSFLASHTQEHILGFC